MTAALSQWLAQRAPRERRLLMLAFALLALALLWWLTIAPVLQTYRASADAHAKLDTELANMQAMAAEAKRIRALPVTRAADTRTWLDASVKKLGKATLSVQGTRAQINFAGASAQGLAIWLAEARTAAQLSPVQANWKRSLGAATSADALWDGVIVLELPAK